MKFEKTAAAVRAYDKAMDEQRVVLLLDGLGDDEKDRRLAVLEEEIKRAFLAIKEAFAEETADVNSRENAMLVTPDGHDGWLRERLVDAGHVGVAPIKSERAKRGWGW